jgi:hypothetical protein
VLGFFQPLMRRLAGLLVFSSGGVFGVNGYVHFGEDLKLSIVPECTSALTC